MSNGTGCPKCGGEMNEGKIMDEKLWYKSQKSPTGFFSSPGLVNLHHARACLTCGYLEMYLDPQDLAHKIAAA